MTERRPLVVVNGDITELPSGDTLPGGGGAGGEVSLLFTDVGVVNGNFETGDMTGWTVDTGTATVHDWSVTTTWAYNTVVSANNGTYGVVGGAQPLLEFHQDIDISGDTGVLFYEASCDALKDYVDTDVASLTIELYATGSVLLNSETLTYSGTAIGIQQLKRLITPQSGAVTIRLIAKLTRNTGTNNNCAIDNISLNKITVIGGNTILNGTSNPTTEGVDGDFFLNTTSSTLFGPKASGTWPSGVSLIGANGADGANGSDGANGADGFSILNGTVDPTTEGVNGDFYINTTTMTFFGPKAAGVWPSGILLVDQNGLPYKVKARYWRITGLEQASATGRAIAEVVINQSGSPLSITGVSALTTFSGYPASNVIDANAATFWSSNGLVFNEWFRFDFGTVVTPDEITITARNDSNYTQAPQRFRVEYSYDDVTWFHYGTTAEPITAYTTGSSQTFDLSALSPFTNIAQLPDLTGNAGKLLKVNATEDGLDSVDLSLALSTEATSRNLTNADFAGNKILLSSSASAITFTIPSGLTGTEPVTIVQDGAGQVTIAAGAGATLNSADGNAKSRVQYSSMTLVPVGTNTYLLMGDLTA